MLSKSATSSSVDVCTWGGYYFNTYLFPTKGLFEIAIAKAHETIRRVDEDQINLLVINEVKEFLQAFELSCLALETRA